MRLIDKNRLIDDVTDRKYSQASMRLIREQPEVEAIPIEWIKKWEQKEENYYLFKDLTRKLIEDWEKENEVQN